MPSSFACLVVQAAWGQLTSFVAAFFCRGAFCWRRLLCRALSPLPSLQEPSLPLPFLAGCLLCCCFLSCHRNTFRCWIFVPFVANRLFRGSFGRSCSITAAIFGGRFKLFLPCSFLLRGAFFAGAFFATAFFPRYDFLRSRFLCGSFLRRSPFFATAFLATDSSSQPLSLRVCFATAFLRFSCGGLLGRRSLGRGPSWPPLSLRALFRCRFHASL